MFLFVLFVWFRSMLSFKLDSVIFFYWIDGVYIQSRWLYLGHSPNDWLGRKIPYFFIDFFSRVVVLGSAGTSKCYFFSKIFILKLISIVPPWFVIWTVSFYFENTFDLFVSFHQIANIGQFLNSIFVLSLYDQHEGLYYFFPVL